MRTPSRGICLTAESVVKCSPTPTATSATHVHESGAVCTMSGAKPAVAAGDEQGPDGRAEGFRQRDEGLAAEVGETDRRRARDLMTRRDGEDTAFAGHGAALDSGRRLLEARDAQVRRVFGQLSHHRRAVATGPEGEVDAAVPLTNAPVADLFVVFARTREPDADGPGIAVFLVPADTPGVSVGPKDAKMGQEGAWTADVIFEEVRVGESALVGGAEEIGYRAAMTSLARGRIHIAALAVGCAQRALDESVAYAAANTQGGIPIGEHQLVQAMLADQYTGVAAGRALVRDAAAAYDSGADRRVAPSAAKLFCTEMAGRVADLAVQAHGGTGYMRDVPVERIYREVRLLRLYEGTSEIQRLIIGGSLYRDQERGRGSARQPSGPSGRVTACARS